MANAAIGELHVGEFGATTVATVTSSDAHFQPTSSYSEYLIYVDTDTCFKRGAAATVNDLLIKGGNYVRIHIDRPNGEALHWIAATGAADGAIRITEVN